MAGCGCQGSGRAAGTALMLVGLGLLGAGAWARQEVRKGLVREHITAPGEDGTIVSGASAARSLAELIRERTIASTGGRTYSETDEYLALDGSTTADSAVARRDEVTGVAVANPDIELWIRSTALQTALMQAYLAFRLADLMVAVGGSFALAGIGLRAAATR